MAKRGRKPGVTSAEMQEMKRRAISLMEINPTLSMQRVADHYGVSASTVSRWFKEADFRRWRS